MHAQNGLFAPARRQRKALTGVVDKIFAKQVQHALGAEIIVAPFNITPSKALAAALRGKPDLLQDFFPMLLPRAADLLQLLGKQVLLIHLQQGAVAHGLARVHAVVKQRPVYKNHAAPLGQLQINVIIFAHAAVGQRKKGADRVSAPKVAV